MHAAIAMPGNTAATFLVHFFGSGFEDERYVVERFQALADGDIRRMPGDEPIWALLAHDRSISTAGRRSATNPPTEEVAAKRLRKVRQGVMANR